jgi:hypothetical protein
MTCIEFLRAIKDVAHVLDDMEWHQLEFYLNCLGFNKAGITDYLIYLDDGEGYQNIKTVVVKMHPNGDWGAASWPRVPGNWIKGFQRIVNAYAKEIADG